jgi:hypothetical protein
MEVLSQWILDIQDKHKQSIEDLDRIIKGLAQQVLDTISEKPALKKQQDEQINFWVGGAHPGHRKIYSYCIFSGERIEISSGCHPPGPPRR